MLKMLLLFTISLLIGLLIGIERERSHPEGVQFIGVRTFTLLSLLGTLIATFNQATLTLTVSAFVFSLLFFNYFRIKTTQKKKIDNGIVTELSAGIIYCLGYMVNFSPIIAIELSVIVLLVLIERKRLHTLARKKFKPHEIEAAIILIVLALGILPLLPDRAIDPWQLFNPRNFGLLITTIAAIQFGGYVAIQMFGERLGIAFTGFLGGLVSSTIVFAQLKNTLREHPQLIRATLAAATLATVAMLVDIMVIILVASPALFLVVLWPILTMMILGIIFSVILIHFQKAKNHSPPHFSNPLSLPSILSTALFLGFMLMLIVIAKRYLSTQGVLLISFFGGLIEIHGISLATALLYLENKIPLNEAKLVLYVAIIASFVSKFILLWTLTPYRFALQLSFVLMTLLVSGGVVYWMMNYPHYLSIG